MNPGRSLIKMDIILVIVLLLSSCIGGGGNGDVPPTGSKKKTITHSVSCVSPNIARPSPGDKLRTGEELKVRLLMPGRKDMPDSVLIKFGDRELMLVSGMWEETGIPTEGMLPGRRTLEVTAYREGERCEKRRMGIYIVSDIVPTVYSYEVVNTYPHDKTAYTQGLVYHDGFLYEGTGQRGRSSLRKVVPETGEPWASLNLPKEYFGEGICIFNDRIIQLTWTSGIGFVYDLGSFRLLNKISYPTQGWGISTNGHEYIMSDGSNKLIFLDPNSYSETSRIEVCDNKGPVSNLNELEYINGLVYANVFMTDRIAVVDPSSGKVLSYIDLTGLLKEEDKHPSLDVLNGIAWDAPGKRLFVTGKNWPKLFEIKMVEPQ